MSDELEQELLTRLESLEKLEKLFPLIKWLIAGAFFLGTWVASLELRHQLYAEDHDRLDSLETWSIKTDADRYTVKEAMAINRTMTEVLNSHDKRIQRVEDAQLNIKTSLERIEGKLEDAIAIRN